MLHKILTAIILVPLTLLLVTFAVANRQIVTVSFDPFNSAQPALAATMPLFLLIFVLLILGVLIGGAAAWLRQARWRRAARRLDAETRRLQEEVLALRRHPGVAEPAAPLVIPPPPV